MTNIKESAIHPPIKFVTDDDDYIYPLLGLEGKVGKILPMEDRKYVDQKLAEKHEQYLLGIITDHDNELAKEFRYLYCSLNEISKISIINLAKTSGLLVGSILFPNNLYACN